MSAAPTKTNNNNIQDDEHFAVRNGGGNGKNHGGTIATTTMLSVASTSTTEPTTTGNVHPMTKKKSLVRWIRDTISSREYTNDELKIGIAGFYYRSSKLWENVLGEHMHHGYYLRENRTDHVQAQIDLIDEVLKWAGVGATGTGTPGRLPTNVIDVGCRIGGSSLHIAKKYTNGTNTCRTTGITLSPYKAQRGNELATEHTSIPGRRCVEHAVRG
jgi:hypothetical protein